MMTEKCASCANKMLLCSQVGCGGYVALEAESNPKSDNKQMVQSLCDGCCNGMCVVPDFDVSFKEYNIKVSKCDRHEAWPETVGEKNTHFDLLNYSEYLENRLLEIRESQKTPTNTTKDSIALLDGIVSDIDKASYEESDLWCDNLNAVIAKLESPC